MPDRRYRRHRLAPARAAFYIALAALEKAMDLTTVTSNPFALMTSPEAVFAAIERSDRLARLKSTICRPLDKPRPEKPIVATGAYDEAIEAMEIAPEPELDVELARQAPNDC